MQECFLTQLCFTLSGDFLELQDGASSQHKHNPATACLHIPPPLYHHWRLSTNTENQPNPSLDQRKKGKQKKKKEKEIEKITFYTYTHTCSPH